jgi:predicted regulator of Ras-like GTPase activity (Roadblock/LC7/MglB family)
MSALSGIAKLPEVRGAVLGDLTGVLVDAIREADGESIAAVMGFVASALIQAGELLGLGALRRVAISAPIQASLMVVDGQSLLGARVEPSRSLTAVEKYVETAYPGQV